MWVCSSCSRAMKWPTTRRRFGSTTAWVPSIPSKSMTRLHPPSATSRHTHPPPLRRQRTSRDPMDPSSNHALTSEEEDSKHPSKVCQAWLTTHAELPRRVEGATCPAFNSWAYWMSCKPAATHKERIPSHTVHWRLTALFELLICLESRVCTNGRTRRQCLPRFAATVDYRNGELGSVALLRMSPWNCNRPSAKIRPFV